MEAITGVKLTWEEGTAPGEEQESKGQALHFGYETWQKFDGSVLESLAAFSALLQAFAWWLL